MVSFVGRRALKNASHLKKLFTRSKALKGRLTSLPNRSYRQQLKEYTTARNVQRMHRKYNITLHQAKRLAECGISTPRLENYN